MTTPSQLALTIAETGWPVFPVRDREEADPETGELLAPKTPLTPNGFKGATRNVRLINAMWERKPTAAIGIPTGSVIGAFVLDIDNKPGGANGFDWLADMEAEHGPLPATRRVTTPNNGLHIYFRYVDGVRNRGALGVGVDIRGEGGYVLAAGSVMADGRAYTLMDDAPIADAPDWLLALLLKPAAAQPTVYAPSLGGINQPYVERAISDELSALASTPAGARNNSLNDAAFALGQFVGAGAISRTYAEQELMAIARLWGNFAKSCGTIRNGLDAGIKSPREIPEAPQDNTRLVDITRMIANAKRKAEAEPVEHTTATEPQQPAATEALHFTPFNWIDPKTLPRREFAFGTHYIRKYVSVTVAPGGLGKTANSIIDGLSMTSGKDLVGIKPPQRMNVAIFNAEDPRDELERRVMAAAIHYKLKPSDFEGRLFIDSGREQELVIARDDKKAGVKIVEPVVEAVVAQIQRHKIDVLIVDPFVSTHRVNENDNGAIDAVAKLWAHIADKTNCAIDIVHHLRKVSDREATVEDARGAVSLIGAARSVRVLNRMTSEQASQAGVPEEERVSTFAITHGKSNLTKLSSKADWRRIESVPLGNGQGLNKPQDHAPVITEWRWPDAEEIAGELTDEQMEHIRMAVQNSDYKESPRAKNWVGVAVAYAIGIDLEDDASRKKVTSIIKALMKEGKLMKVEQRDPVRRETTVFVRAA